MSNFVVQTKLYWINGPLQGKYSRRIVPINSQTDQAEQTINEFLYSVGSVQEEEKNRAIVDSVAVFEPGGLFRVGVVNCVSGRKLWLGSKSGEGVDW